MKLSIIIVSWNVKEKLKENLKYIKQSKTDFEFEVFVVDNNSEDGSPEMVREEFPDIKLIANEENLGFAKANNMAIKRSEGEYILLLNPDMKVHDNTLQEMITWYDEKKDVSVAGCKLIDEKGDLVHHVRRFPSLKDQLAIVLKIPHIIPSVLDGYLRIDFDYNKEAVVDSVRGGFFMINTKLFDNKPLLDERYFLWFEEVDFCRQVKDMNTKVVYTPIARCTDYVGQSFVQLKRSKTQKYFRDSMLKYFYKWHGYPQYLILMIAWTPVIIFSYILDVLKIQSRAKT